jgi:hypothetical protein
MPPVARSPVASKLVISRNEVGQPPRQLYSSNEGHSATDCRVCLTHCLGKGLRFIDVVDAFNVFEMSILCPNDSPVSLSGRQYDTVGKGELQFNA